MYVCMCMTLYDPDKVPTLMCWAKDDLTCPFWLVPYYTALKNVKMVMFGRGGHANFDGCTEGQPNFDDEIYSWYDAATGIIAG